MNAVKRSRVRTLLLAAVIVAVVVAVLWRRVQPHPRRIPQPVATTPAPPEPSAPATAPAAEASPVEPAAAMVLRIEDAHARLTALAARSASPAERAAAALGLRNELRAASQRSSAEAMALFLESGRDAPTGQDFAPAPGGFLETAPTLRTLLLDELERCDPVRAREAAQAVFASAPTVADEWSLALRITAHTAPTGTTANEPEFVTHVQALLGNPGWLAAPSAGFLHGFDAAVYSGDAALVARLAILAGGAQPEAVQFAARLALDRLAMVDYATAAEPLLSDPALLAGDPQFRGMLFARADVSDMASRTVIERFLTDARSTAKELNTWADYFPHRSKHLSNNLLTTDRPTPVAELARMDRAALAAVREWRTNPAMNVAQPLLGTVQARLEQYVASADRGEAARAAGSTP